MKRWTFIAAAALLLPACNWKMKPTFPANRIVESMREMCSRDYKLTVEARRADNTLQSAIWKAGLFKNHAYNLQGMTKDTEDTMDHIFLCATRIALSTDAPLDFIEVKMADVLTGATITLWRYVPDIRDSMYERIGDTEYFNRLVIEINVDKKPSFGESGMNWDKPITMSEFLAKQIINRAKHDQGESLEAHADLSEPSTLGVVIDNWSSIEEEGSDHAAKVTDAVHKTAENVLKGYRYNGFHDMILRDGEGIAVGSWTL